MSFLKFTAIFSLFGFFVPLIFRIFWIFLESIKDMNIHILLQKVMFILWPTSIMAFASSPDVEIEKKFLMFSIFANMVVYAIIGGFIWLGMRKNFGYFFVVAIPLVSIWWWLLALV